MLSRAPLELVVHIGQTIRLLAIFVSANRVKTSNFLCRLFYLSVFGAETISSDEGSIDISNTF